MTAVTVKRRRRWPPGIRPWKGGLQVYLEVAGRTYSKSYPATTPLDELREWRRAQKERLKGVGPVRGSFAADVAEYLERVEAMPTYGQRKAHLGLWLEALGRDRPRRSITEGEIEIVLQGWLATLGPATVRKRRTALQSFFEKMNGKGQANPVRSTSNPRPPKPEARGTDYQTIERILAEMPTYRDTKKGLPRRVSLSKIRAGVLAYTGLPPHILEHVRPDDLDLRHRTVRASPRRKGAGVEAKTLQLTDDGVAWFRKFDAAKAYGRFAVESLNRSFKRARDHAGVTGLTIYDLRHSFGAELYRVTRDLATVARFMLHASLATTARYAAAAMREVDQDAAKRMGEHVQAGRSLSSKPVPTNKRHGRRKLRVAS